MKIWAFLIHNVMFGKFARFGLVKLEFDTRRLTTVVHWCRCFVCGRLSRSLSVCALESAKGGVRTHYILCRNTHSPTCEYEPRCDLCTYQDSISFLHLPLWSVLEACFHHHQPWLHNVLPHCSHSHSTLHRYCTFNSPTHLPPFLTLHKQTMQRGTHFCRCLTVCITHISSTAATGCQSLKAPSLPHWLCWVRRH